MPMVRGGFGTVVADPPWPYDTTVKGVPAMQKPISEVQRGDKGVSDFTYPVMSVEEITELPVRTVAGPNAHLYLWVTNAFMREGFDIMDAWGFKFKTVLTWGKVKKGKTLEPSMKTGWWYRGATEHCLFGVRGKVQKPTAAIPTLLLHERIQRHSEKPETFLTDMVEKVSPGPYLEMFSRRERDGWYSWGNQVGELNNDEGDE
jgi:N6-adenosine-specific RNA methylase IME4